MASYARVTVNTKFGDISDYSDKIVNTSYTWDMTTGTKFEYIRAVGTVTISLASFTTVLAVVLNNKDTTNGSTLTWQSAGGAGRTQIIGAGQTVVLTDVVVAGNLAFVLVAGTPTIEGIVVGT